MYKLEKITVDKMEMHKSCFKCAECHRQLTISNYAAINNTLYCKTHYIKMFKDSGGSYAAFGDAGFKQKSSRTTAAAEAMGKAHSGSVTVKKPKSAGKGPPSPPAAAKKKKPSWVKKESADGDGETKSKGKTALTPYAQKLLRPHSPSHDGDAGDADTEALQAKVKAQAAKISELTAQVSKLKAALAAASSSARAVADQLEQALH